MRRAARKIALDVFGDAGRFDVIMQTLIETMMTGNVVPLAAFFVLTHPMAAPLDKIVTNLHLNDGADPGEAIDQNRDQSVVALRKEIRLIGRLWIVGRFFLVMGMLSISASASSGVRTGVLPFLTV